MPLVKSMLQHVLRLKIRKYVLMQLFFHSNHSEPYTARLPNFLALRLLAQQ